MDIIKKIEIDDKIIASTTRCNDQFSCLAGDLAQLCQVEDCISKEVYFVRCAEAPTCNYKIPFAREYVCSCPVRQEIFNRYEI